MTGDYRAHDIIQQFNDAASRFDINSRQSFAHMTTTLDAIAVELGQSEELRAQVGSLDLALWKHAKRLWRELVRAQLSFWDGDDDDEEETKQNSLRSLCAALARFTRNIVAGVPDNQMKAFDVELDLRRLLHYYTSWTSQDEHAVVVARVLTQALSNMVTGNDSLMSKLWEMYMNLSEDQVVLIRLLASRDRKTLLAVLILIRNCIQNSRTRTKMITRTHIGARICVLILDNMTTLYDAEVNSDGGRAFDTGYEIFTRIMQVGLIPDLYMKLTIEDEIVAPHQTTLLKLIDSYLQAGPQSPTSASSASSSRSFASVMRSRSQLCPVLGRTFLSLSAYTQAALRKALGNGISSVDTPLVEIDVMLPKVCEASVLVTQCIITLALDRQALSTQSENIERHPFSPGPSPPSPTKNPKAYFNSLSIHGIGIIETLLECLRLLDVFLPRINFGKAVINNKQSEHADKNDGFSYLKRDLVRLLGVLCHGTKVIQDRVRQCGGIELLMNLCVVDERNPYLREHAIFTLHNVLQGNTANQAVVDSIRPTWQWDQETGELKDAASVTQK